MVTQREFQQEIKNMGIPDLSKFAKGKTLSEFWEECDDGCWILMVYVKLYPDNVRERVLAAGHCAATVSHLMKDQRSIDAVKAAIDFGNGKIDEQQLKKAHVAAYDAAINANAATAAALAADAAYYAAEAAAFAANAAYAAVYATNAAADAANTLREQNQRQTAEICRMYLNIVIDKKKKTKISKKDLLRRIEILEKIIREQK
jgi:hypothetical protein